MLDWKISKIADLATKVGMGPFGSSIKVETFVEDGIPIISGANLKNTRLEDIDYHYISVEHANKLKNANVYRGDVIFTHAGNIGAVAFIPEKSKYDRYVLSQRQFFLRCNPDKLLPAFITYYFKSTLGQHKLLANSSSVGVPSIAKPVTYLKSIEVKVPHVSIQEKIIEVLSSLDDKIELNLQMNKTLEAIAQAIFKEWVLDFRFPGFDGGLIDGLPKGWRKGTILEIANLLSGGTPKTETKEYWDGTIKWISAKDITTNDSGFILSTEKCISETGLSKSSAKLLPELTTVVSARGTVGKYCIIPEPMAISQSNYGLKAKRNNSDFFLFLMVENMIESMQAYSYGTVFDTITTKTFHEIDVVLPSHEIVILFNDLVTPLYHKILLNSRQNESLSHIRDNILPKLMTGKIRVA